MYMRKNCLLQTAVLMLLSHNRNAISIKLNPLSLSCFIPRKVIEHCSNFKEENMDTSR